MAAVITTFALVTLFLRPIPLFERADAWTTAHTLLELVAITVSAMVAALCWSLRHSHPNSHTAVLGAAFAAMGLVDAMHALSVPSMPPFLTENTEDKAQLFYFASRAIGAVAMVWVSATSPVRWSRPAVAGTFTAGFGLVLAAAWLGMAGPHSVAAPPWAAGALEVAIAAVYAVGAGKLALGSGPSTSGRRGLALACWAFAIAGLFVFREEGMRDSHVVLGHLFSGFAHVAIYRALFVDGVEAPYKIIAEQARLLQESTATLTSVVEGLPIGVLVTDDAGTIRLANAALAAQFGYSAADLIGRPVETLVPTSMRTGHSAERASFHRTRGSRKMGTTNVRGQRADGSTFQVEIGLRPVEIAGEQLTLAASVDLTERLRDAEELERHRHHLEELVEAQTRDLTAAVAAADAANRAKSMFLANMSHEIRTPMHAIFGMSTLIRAEPLSLEQRRRLDKLDSAARHLLGIIGDVLDLPKVEAGKLELEREPVDVADMVDGVVALLSLQAASKGLDLRASGHRALPVVIGDVTRIRQCLLNLTNNAIKFTDSGTVEIRVSADGQNTGGVTLEFSVHDTGRGLRAEQIERLFQPFEQADATITRAHGGTGLGLAITRSIARLMGGEAGAESEAGRGSRFWFRVRLDLFEGRDGAAILVDTEDPLASLQQRHAGRRVLVVDDDLVNCEIASEVLRHAGLVVDVANDGADGLARATGVHAAILLDMHMPRMGGLEAAVRLREDPNTRHTPIVAMTASAYASDRQACIDAGMNDFIAKPVTDPTLVYATLLRWLDDPRG